MRRRFVAVALMACLLLLLSVTTNASISPPKSLTKQIQGGAAVATGKKRVSKETKSETPAVSSSSASIFNLVKSIVGAGVLGLPAGIAAFGNAPAAVIPAAVLTVAIGLLSAYGFWLIGRVCALTNTSTYGDAWSKAVSPRTSWIPATACLLVTAGSCLSYSMILADTLPQLCQAFVGTSLSRTHALLGITLVVLLPLCLLKSMSKLAPFSLVGIFGMIYTAVAMGIRYVTGAYREGGALYDKVPVAPSFGTSSSIWTPSAFVLVSMLSTAYMAHYNAPKFLDEVDRDLTNYRSVVSISFVISILLFIAVSSLGFLTFGESCSGLVLHNYATQDALMSVSRIAVAISIICSYPLAFVGVRDGVLNLLAVKNRSDATLNSITVALLAMVTGLALVVKDLTIVLAFAGATWANAVVYLFSSYMYVSLARSESLPHVPLAKLTGLTGLTMCIIGTSQAIKSMKT